ncbi:MAG TPA: hypothetical protein VLJ61_08845 [Pyrinomonadaceae bacterium]|nr:hypothetical protein [Pyrinomonadaceae bacterium]
MTTGTQKANAAARPFPTLSNSLWTLQLTGGSEPPPGLERCDSLSITRQEQNLDTLSISGFVTDTIENSYYPLNGQVDAESVVTFFVTIKDVGDSVYFFKGRVQVEAGNMSMAGTFKLVPPDDENEDGNWSAQAQGGGDDDDRPDPKHRHRHSR